MTILTFHDDRLPEAVIEPMNGLSSLHVKNCRKNMGVSVDTINGIEYLIADGYCPRHDDWEEISVLWLVRNDSNSWVWSQGSKKVSKEQSVGTVIVLDINKEHGLNCKNGVKSAPAVWAAALVGKLDKWPSEERLQSLISDFLSNPRTIVDGQVP